jgi:predicted metal-dependent phosphoesterase TrpH
MTRQQLPEIFANRNAFLHKRQTLHERGYFVADMHVHSAQSDGIHSLKRIAAHCLRTGLSIAVTDHNRIPNLCGLSAAEISCLVPAIEVTSNEFVDILCYFYNFESLTEFYRTVVEPHRIRPYMISLSCNEILPALRERKCVVTIPHPDYPVGSLRKNFIRVEAEGGISAEAMAAVHCIEVFNASRDKDITAEKQQLTDRLGKYPIVGSDAHTQAAVGNSLVYCRASNHTEFLDHIAQGEARGIALPTKLVDRSLPKLKMAWLHIKGLLALS